MIVLDNFEELTVIVGGEPRVWQRFLSKDMVPEQYFMEETMSKLGVGGCLQECSDEERESSKLDIEESQATIFWLPIQGQLTGLLQTVLVHP